MRIVILAAAILLPPGFTQAELEKAKSAKDFFKDGYWKCLATEIVRVAPTNMPVQDFSVFVKGTCGQEKGWFFNSLINYMTMLHPERADDYSLLASAANIAVKAAQDDAVKVLIDMRSRSKAK